jgi:hypothetical protein
MKRTLFVLLLISVTLLLAASVWGQGKVYEGPDDPAGDDAARREGYMNGNRVLIEFKNTTELSDWPDPEASKWPNTYYGYKMTDGIGLLISSRVFIEGDTTPVDDPAEIAAKGAAGLLDTLFYCQTSYREEQDVDPASEIEWNLKAVPTYLNPDSETPAIGQPDGSQQSWPVNGWPDVGDALKWPGEWDGFFGRGVFNADLETYFAANDAQDQEYLPLNTQHTGPWYYPRPGHYIGDKRPDVSIQYGEPWGGLGIRVEQRGFQWSNPQARDCIFWQYTIANISDYDLNEVAFGYWLDNALGGEGLNLDVAAFDVQEDLAYAWVGNAGGTGTGGRPCGTSGFAFLESPSISWDGDDNDTDGITDEKRDNLATVLVGPTESGSGIPYSDLNQFMRIYKLSENELREHWDADEDQDWNDGEDLNGNGKYDPGEYPGDDVGTDGVAPGDLNYEGPDPDGTEGNHRPDQNTTGCEPDFGETDISESDMLGLTMFDMYPVPEHIAPFPLWFRNDKTMFEQMAMDSLNPFFGTPRNLSEIFASGMFPLYQGRTERISMSELHSYDPIAGLSSADHTAPALFRLKRTVQIIYNRDYRFAKPPLTPTLTATPGDGYVILTWDNRADLLTVEPFLDRINDFEGYKLYRATDKTMSDAMTITDGFGTPTLYEPIFECDKTDGITDFATYGQVNGQGYFLGSDKGLAHSFVDSTVQNGRTYYYVLVSYDYGIHPDSLAGDSNYEENEGISPAESPFVIELDETEAVARTSINVAEVTPRVQSAGYVTGSSTEVNSDKALGSGVIIPEVVARGAVKQGHNYMVTFDNTVVGREVRGYEDHGGIFVTSGLKVFDVVDGGKSLVYNDVLEELPDGPSPTLINTTLIENEELDVWHIQAGDTMITGIFDGIQLKVFSPVITAEYDSTQEGWLQGTGAEPNIVVSTEEGNNFPWTYQIEFGQPDSVLYTSVVSNVRRILDETGTVIDREDILPQLSFNFRCYTTLFTDSTGAYENMDLLVFDENANEVFDMTEDRIIVGPVTNDDDGRWAGTVFLFDFKNVPEDQLPKPGDVYQLGWTRPFFKRDTVTFAVTIEDAIVGAALDAEMEDIHVVPNPYVGTNVMEPALARSGLNQRRRLMFTHIPAQCTIKIFTVSGVLIDEINVDNEPDNGIVHWDLRSKEGLEIAAGMYLFHVKSEKTGKEKLGKFAVIK